MLRRCRAGFDAVWDKCLDEAVARLNTFHVAMCKQWFQDVNI